MAVRTYMLANSERRIVRLIIPDKTPTSTGAEPWPFRESRIDRVGGYWERNQLSLSPDEWGILKRLLKDRAVARALGALPPELNK